MDFVTDNEIKAIEYNGKEFFAKDKSMKNLFLHIKPNSKLWIFRYKSPLTNTQRKISIGAYPKVTLANARDKAREHQRALNDNADPLELKREDKLKEHHQKENEKLNDNSQLHRVVQGWLDNYSKRVSAVTLKKETARIENHILKPFSEYNNEGFIISSKSISKISRAELSNILTDISNDKAETADRLFSHCKGIWLYAVSKGFIDIDRNIVSNIDKKNTMAKVDNKHRPKITDEATLKELLTAIDNYPHNIIIKQLLKLVCHIPLRAENISSLKWEYVDFENRILTIPRNLMKVKNKNIPNFKLPLTKQVIEILQDTQKYFNHDVWVFPSFNKSNQHINKESPNKALKIMGFGVEPKKQTMHSFRGTFRSLAETYTHIHNATKETKEAVLDHIEKNPSILAYMHRADYTNQMIPLLEWWSNYLDEVKNG
ncbi:MAG: integrase arm-type DNA-binding domain-containing protein [Sulfurovaceae bacterium]|nr:integrase arm-type DNA-binding domain-containing protein [Sulfurovaceae bacterium]MDD5548199.1 integrase arm-type DNA-binding domain-containing protein [Sulfurovaceae bacterium]